MTPIYSMAWRMKFVPPPFASSGLRNLPLPMGVFRNSPTSRGLFLLDGIQSNAPLAAALFSTETTCVFPYHGDVGRHLCLPSPMMSTDGFMPSSWKPLINPYVWRAVLMCPERRVPLRRAIVSQTLWG